MLAGRPKASLQRAWLLSTPSGAAGSNVAHAGSSYPAARQTELAPKGFRAVSGLSGSSMS